MLNKEEKLKLKLEHDASGIARQLDRIGRIVIPKEIIKRYEWKTEAYGERIVFEILDYDGIIVLKPIGNFKE